VVALPVLVPVVRRVVERPAVHLQRLHLPVGGRRFRPTLEDLIDFLIIEKLVTDCRPDWAEEVAAGRERFRRRQLMAVVRRDPESALESLCEAGLL
jgi:hypothetical protein